MALQQSEQRIDPSAILSHEVFMKRAIELAANGVGHVSPNPLVGCVIVNHGQIIGEGWHAAYGGPHAEVDAVANVEEKGRLKDSTVYVNLEPCSHTGKTPPCADMLIRHEIQTVVIANQDPNPLVAGGGIRKLRAAGVNVVTDVLPTEGFILNKRFFTFMNERRPHIILKWAETSDGFIARKDNNSKWISDEYSRQLVHKWRTQEDAVLVASGTAWYDNPMLTVRHWSGRNPIRLVIDRYLKLGANQHLFDGKQQTICYNLVKGDSNGAVSYVRLEEANLLEQVVHDLYQRRIQSVIVEGGAQLLNSFIRLKLWDEARIFISPTRFGTGIPAPAIRGVVTRQQKLDNDWLKVLEPSHD